MFFSYCRIALIAVLLSAALLFSRDCIAAAIWVLLVFKSGIPVALVAPAATYGTTIHSASLTSLPGYYAAALAPLNTLLLFVTTAQLVVPTALAVFLASPLDAYYLFALWFGSWHHSTSLFFEFLQISAIGATMLLCLKCLFVFLLIVLVRVTTPKFKLETITKLGWLYSLSMLFSVFFSYWTGFFLF